MSPQDIPGKIDHPERLSMQATPLKKSNDIRIAANPDWEIIIQSVLINVAL